MWCEKSCPIINSYDLRIANARYYAGRQASAVQDRETEEINARLRYVAAEESVLDGTLSPRLNSRDWIKIHGMLADMAEEALKDAVNNSQGLVDEHEERGDRISSWRENALKTCSPLACSLATLRRTAGIGRFACGSTDPMAKASIRNLASGRTKPPTLHS